MRNFVVILGNTDGTTALKSKPFGGVSLKAKETGRGTRGVINGSDLGSHVA